MKTVGEEESFASGRMSVVVGKGRNERVVGGRRRRGKGRKSLKLKGSVEKRKGDGKNYM